MGVIIVGMADLKVAKVPDTLTTLGLGSCVGITLYDSAKKIGGLAHIMLPTYKGFEGQTVAKFADSAIIELIKQMERVGSSRGRLIAKLAGGAHMFGSKQNSDIMKIGERNVSACVAILKQLSIPIESTDTGGARGRTIELNPDNGALKIKTTGAGERFI
jgi:chemotaxis protein CheD